MAQHKWHKEIKAWADGAEIQFRHMSCACWDDCSDKGPLWDKDTYYRVKPSEPRLTRIGEIENPALCWNAIELTPEVIEALKVANIGY